MSRGRTASAAVLVLGLASLPGRSPVAAQAGTAPAGTKLEQTISPGTNFDKANFTLWYAQGTATFRAVVLLVPGSNGDGRPMVDDPFWQAFAASHQVALVGCQITDKPHDQNFIEAYVNVSEGSGPAVLEALAKLGDASKHPELARAPLLLWGMSAGGQFNYEFTAWKPDRVAAFIVNKGGIYYHALLSQAARAVPGLLFTGEKDLASRIETITGLFAVNRRGGAVWALVQEPGATHVVGRSQEFGALFFDELMPLRIAPDGTLKPLAGPGFVGDLTTRTYQPAAAPGTPGTPNVWLPTERIARAWQAVVTGQPF